MPKLKTNRGAKKRFKLTASGKVKRKRAYLRHILTNKGKKQKRQLRRDAILGTGDANLVKQLLPYG